MKKIHLFICLLLSILLTGCGSKAEMPGGRVLYIQNETLKAGFLPEVGGRLVYLARVGEDNLLKSDTLLWFEPEGDMVSPDPDGGFKSYFGHIIWPGPQSGWWLNQELNQKRREGKASWPPDPYLIYSGYEVEEQTPSSILFEGPPSPVTGVSLTKRYTLSGNSIKIDVSMKNRTDKPVAWDIWSNARFNGDTDFFVPNCEGGILRIASEDSPHTDRMNHKLTDGAFTFIPAPPGPGKQSRYSKAYLHPGTGNIVAIRDSTMLVMDFSFVPPESIHPDQGFVEIYQRVSRDGASDLLELEHHSAYAEMLAGESIELSETWFIYDYQGAKSMPAYLTYYYNLTN